MIRICSGCGALLLDDSENCSFCNLSSPEKSQASEREQSDSLAARAKTVGEPIPEWRLEVARRLDEYCAKRGRPRPHPVDMREDQPALPFRPADRVDDPPQTLPDAPRSRSILRGKQNERVEISAQPELDFSSASVDRGRPQTALVPVASLAQRRWAGLIDLICLAAACTAFVALFLFTSRSVGGTFVFEKVDTGVYLTAIFLFYTLYFSLFVTLAGATPGMQLMGLTIVRLDGSLPDTRQLVWRSFGYVLSGATFAMGFVWSLWDEDRFTWQDRISQTYITAAAPLREVSTFGMNMSSRRQSLAHK